jgi:hypothetical protein
MKTAEDEAFEDIERRQGGGFKAKQAMAEDKVGHFEKWWYYEGSCPPYTHHDCEEHTKRMCKIAWSNGAYLAAQPAQEPVAHLWECLGRWSAYLVSNGGQAECAPPSWLIDAIQNATTPPKREWVGLTEDEVKRCGFAVPFGGAQDWALRFSQTIEAKLKEKNA